MENFEEKACLCALGKIFGFKPKIATALIEHLGFSVKLIECGAENLKLTTPADLPLAEAILQGRSRL